MSATIKLNSKNVSVQRNDAAPTQPILPMTRSDSIAKLAAALASAQAEMPVAVFDATNPFLKSKYASLGTVIKSSRAILAKHRLSLVQFPISDDNDSVGVESILCHESGEFVADRITIPLVEEKGKSKVQAAGSTLTYLRRYSWAAILGMYADEDQDGASPVQAFQARPPVPPMPRP